VKAKGSDPLMLMSVRREALEGHARGLGGNASEVVYPLVLE